MTFKDLQKLVQLKRVEPEPELQPLRDTSKHKSNYRAIKGACCFNHIIGLPKKEGKKKTNV
jgi:hypothetical protein